jgi:hypothetical protein
MDIFDRVREIKVSGSLDSGPVERNLSAPVPAAVVGGEFGESADFLAKVEADQGVGQGDVGVRPTEQPNPHHFKSRTLF